MLYWAALFVIGLLAAFLGFSGVAQGADGITKLLLVAVALLTVVFLVVLSRPRVTT